MGREYEVELISSGQPVCQDDCNVFINVYFMVGSMHISSNLGRRGGAPYKYFSNISLHPKALL